jgi:isopenicillin N synthase-like dioxygenase
MELTSIQILKEVSYNLLCGMILTGLKRTEASIDLKESFLHNYEPDCEPIPPTLTDEQRALLHQNLWPEDDAAFKEACFKYDRNMITLMRKMIQMFALGLGLDEHFFDHKVTHPLASCKMIHYPPQDSTSENEIGIGAHTDFVCK